MLTSERKNSVIDNANDILVNLHYRYVKGLILKSTLKRLQLEVLSMAALDLS